MWTEILQGNAVCWFFLLLLAGRREKEERRKSVGHKEMGNKSNGVK